MLTGYVWLGSAGVVLIAFPPGATAFGYDVALHAVLIGFVVSMVFGHALVILPAVARIRLRYAPILYLPLALLHASVALRVGGGLAGWDSMTQGKRHRHASSPSLPSSEVWLVARWRDGSTRTLSPTPIPGVDPAA